ncbi:enoyl-CoA hydratase-related protein [Paranoxybacillus vitaminiphilus]|uniref:enoyl-CoA hydratase-related protein n=1 Tax=Paranoxybacillus vitaminiphilus TaxID=581036 RepID=UPI002482E3BA|nr:enoyl-CoA hydratase-related protein [Anoxybacillus vitaminiphilus]
MALSLKLLQELGSLLQEIAEKREVKIEVVVIEGSTKVFCAGHSLREIETMNVHEVLNLLPKKQNLIVKRFVSIYNKSNLIFQHI